MDVKFLRGTRQGLMEHWHTISDGAICLTTDYPRLYVKMDGKLLPLTNPIVPKMLARTCVKCGAPLPDRGDQFSVIAKCDYCGTIFDLDTPDLFE